MITFIQNAQVLSSAFGALVLAIDHKGWSKEDRPRGNSSLYSAADAQIFCQRLPDGYSASMTLQKMKDGPNYVRLTAYLESVPLYVDEDGDEVTTLVVDKIEDSVAPRAERLASENRPRCPRQQRRRSMRSMQPSRPTGQSLNHALTFQPGQRSSRCTNGESWPTAPSYLNRTRTIRKGRRSSERTTSWSRPKRYVFVTA